ncbi:MAG: ABC transporter permease, partial [Verrucomicrobiota bacterium]
MLSYLIRRLFFFVPIVVGVMLLTFVLFFMVQSPKAVAVRVLGPKATPQAVENWIHNRGYDKPLLINRQQGQPWHDSLFISQMRRLATLDLGSSDVTGRPLAEVFRQGALPSLLLTVPAFVAGLVMSVGLA